MLKIIDDDGRNIGESVYDKLNRIYSIINDCGKDIQNALYHSTINHFKTIYPSSNHYNPEKVTRGSIEKTSASINIDVAGITRAFHDMDIKPKRAKYLTVPLHTSAYGKRATEFNDLICITSKKGKKFLVRNDGAKIKYLYILCKQVHQDQDERLLPKAETYRDNILARIVSRIYNQKNK